MQKDSKGEIEVKEDGGAWPRKLSALARAGIAMAALMNATTSMLKFFFRG